MIVRQAQGQRSAPLSAPSNNALPHAPAKQIPRVWNAVMVGVAMIAKRILRERGASNFRRLGRYILPTCGRRQRLATPTHWRFSSAGARAEKT